MLEQIIASALWVMLIGLDVILSVRLALFYRQDSDKRKLMFIIGLLLCSNIYSLAIIGVNSSTLAARIFEWSPMPILFAFIFSLLNEKFQMNLNKLFIIFLCIVALTVGFYVLPVPFISLPVLVAGLIGAVGLSIIQYRKRVDVAGLLLTFSIPSFAICFYAISINMVELALFGGFIAKAFLFLAFEAGKTNTQNTPSILNLEKQLSTTEENFGTLFNLLPDPAVIVDHTGIFIEVTDGVTKKTGFTKEDIMGKNFLEVPIITAKSKAIMVKNMAKRMMGFHIAPYEVEVIDKQGKKLSFEINASAIEYKGKKSDMVIFRDLTERKVFIESIKEKEERFRNITENTGDWVWEVDSQGKYVYSNDAIEKILGYGSEEIIGKKYSDILSSEKGHAEIFDAALRNNLGHMEITKACNQKEGKKIFLESKAVAVLNSEGKVVGFRGVDRDITEKKALTKKLLESQRFASIGELAGMVGHDLRNPLTSIKTAAYYLKTKRPSMNSSEKEMFEIIEKSITYSDKIISDLLDYSREIKLDLDVTSPKLLTANIFCLVNVPPNVLISNLTQENPKVRVDSAKMSRVLVNVVKNALDAMPNGGTLTITSKASADTLEINFTDTGVGMSKETLSKLWVPLFTTKAIGMGFGLSICKRIVDAHKGKISAQSITGKGTTITISLPLSQY